MCHRKCKQRKELRELLGELEEIRDKKPEPSQPPENRKKELEDRAEALIIEVKDIALVSLDDIEGSRKRLEFLKDVWGEGADAGADLVARVDEPVYHAKDEPVMSPVSNYAVPLHMEPYLKWADPEGGDERSAYERSEEEM